MAGQKTPASNEKAPALSKKGSASGKKASLLSKITAELSKKAPALSKKASKPKFRGTLLNRQTKAALVKTRLPGFGGYGPVLTG